MNVSELVAGREAHIKDNGIKGELYFCESKKLWYVLHNDTLEGNQPSNWDSLKKSKGYKNSWQISDEGQETTLYGVVMQSKSLCMEYKTGDALPASMHNRHAKIICDGDTTVGILFYQDGHFFFLSSKKIFDGVEPNNWYSIKKEYDVKYSWHIQYPNGVLGNLSKLYIDDKIFIPKKEEPLNNRIFTKGDSILSAEFLHEKKVKVLRFGTKANGILYNKPDTGVYFMSDSLNFNGTTPPGWEEISKTYGFKYSWKVADSGRYLKDCDSMEIIGRFEDGASEPKIEPPKKILNTGDSLTKTYHHLSKVILREKKYRESSGFLFCSNTGSWYFLSAENKFGGTMPNELKELRETYDIRGGWQVTGNNSSEVTIADDMEIEFVGGVAEKKDPNVLNSGDVLNPDLHLRYAKLFTKYTVAEGIIYYCPGNKFYVFLSNHDSYKEGGGPEGWGHTVNSCLYKNVYSLTTMGSSSLAIPNDITLKLMPGYYDLVIKPKKGEKIPVAAHSHSRDFKEGDRVRCLNSAEMYKEFKRYSFYHGGDARMYSGTTGVIKKILSAKAVEVRWDLDGREYTMLKEELHFEPVLDCSASMRTSTSTTKLYIRGLEPPTSTDSFHLKEKSELDNIPSGELDTFSPNKISTDSDVRGTQVPRNKEIENLILLGL